MMHETDINDNNQNKTNKNKLNNNKFSFISLFKTLDLYTKIDEDYKVQTQQGAFLSIFGWIVITILVLSQLSIYLTPVIKEHMVVDTSLGKKLRINFNITFHGLTCNQVHLDAMDVAGDNQLNLEHEYTSRDRILPDKSIISDDIIQPIHTDFKPKSDCLSCYGAESETRKCCNTCSELLDAYNDKGWNTFQITKTASVCQHDPSNPNAKYKPGEGCRVAGSIRVNKVSGNIHIAEGISIIRDGRHIHQYDPNTASEFNISHTVHSFSFGDPFPNMKRNPLDGLTQFGIGLKQYYIKIIPTIYTDEWGYKHVTNQYTFTERFRDYVPPDPMNENAFANVVIPGVFFIYELSPFMIEIEKSYMPFSHFYTKLCAIIGGIYSTLGVVDGIIYKFTKLTKRRVNN